IHHVVEAASLLVEYNPNFLIEIYGSGDQEKKLKDLIKSKGLTENVILKGYTDNIENVYKEAAFSIVTSKTEGFSLSILESMANGVPVLSYNFNYGPEDIITNGKDGLIIEKNNIKQLAENMNYLFSNPELINEMRINAAKRDREHTSELQSRFDLVCRLLLEKKNDSENSVHRADTREGGRRAVLHA